MLRNKLQKTIVATMIATTLIGGISSMGISSVVDTVLNNPTVAYAATFNPNNVGLKTATGWVTTKITAPNVPQGVTKAELIKLAQPLPDAYKNDIGSFDFAKGNLDGNLYHYHNEDEWGMVTDMFFKVLSMKPADSDSGIPGRKAIQRTMFMAIFLEYDGEISENIEYNKIATTDCYTNEEYRWADYLIAESESTPTPKPEPEQPAPTPTPQPEKKVYSSIRLGGANRFTTATAVAKQVNSGKLDAVVIANGFNFPDALTGTTLAGQKNAPILLVGNDKYDNTTLDYIKANLKSNGTVYVLGGNGVVTDKVINKIKSFGFNNIKRLGGKDRFATNISIVNELNVPKGTDIIISNANSYADSLSISGVAGGKNMPIFLVDGTLTSTIANRIKSIAPKNIYIVGDTGVVSSGIENQLKSYGKVVRLGGKDRFATSLKIANYFTSTSQTTAAVAYSQDFPDALTGGVLASKTSSPVLLVKGDASSQKAFLDKTKINKLYILGGTGVISDATVKQLTK